MGYTGYTEERKKKIINCKFTNFFEKRYFPKTREHALDAITEFAIEIHRRTIKYFNRLN